MCLLGFVLGVLLSQPVQAGSRSALVTVSVQVVESCRVEVGNGAQDASADLRMRCTSTARPNLGLAGSSQAIAPVGSITLPHSQIATTENGRTLSILF